jgi:hypothetical protein
MAIDHVWSENKRLPVLMVILGAVLCAAAGVCLYSGSGSPVSVAGMFTAGLALVFWRRYRFAACVCGVVALALACAGEVHDIVRGQESFWWLVVWASIIVLSIIGGVIDRRWAGKHKVADEHHEVGAQRAPHESSVM